MSCVRLRQSSVEASGMIGALPGNARRATPSVAATVCKPTPAVLALAQRSSPTGTTHSSSQRSGVHAGRSDEDADDEVAGRLTRLRVGMLLNCVVMAAGVLGIRYAATSPLDVYRLAIYICAGARVARQRKFVPSSWPMYRRFT